jgi:hypothetical protein
VATAPDHRGSTGNTSKATRLVTEVKDNVLYLQDRGTWVSPLPVCGPVLSRYVAQLRSSEKAPLRTTRPGQYSHRPLTVASPATLSDLGRGVTVGVRFRKGPGGRGRYLWAQLVEVFIGRMLPELAQQPPHGGGRRYLWPQLGRRFLPGQPGLDHLNVQVGLPCQPAVSESGLNIATACGMSAACAALHAPDRGLILPGDEQNRGQGAHLDAGDAGPEAPRRTRGGTRVVTRCAGPTCRPRPSRSCR